MSISCEAYVGYTVTLKTNLKEEDFDFFYRAMEEIELPNQVHLVVDGMCGHYARLIYADKIIGCWMEDVEYLPLRPEKLTIEIYDALNKVYKHMYNRDLRDLEAEYAISFHFY